MPRTVEHIVACHQAATALRKAGKPVWSKRIDVKAIIHEDRGNESPEHISAICQRVAALIRSQAPAAYFDIGHEDFDFDFVDAVEAMESCTIKDLAEDKANGCEAVDMFNGWLETIYDWADVNRIWLGN
jgi:hypothetical protein